MLITRCICQHTLLCGNQSKIYFNEFNLIYRSNEIRFTRSFGASNKKFRTQLSIAPNIRSGETFNGAYWRLDSHMATVSPTDQNRLPRTIEASAHIHYRPTGSTDGPSRSSNTHAFNIRQWRSALQSQLTRAKQTKKEKHSDRDTCLASIATCLPINNYHLSIENTTNYMLILHVDQLLYFAVFFFYYYFHLGYKTGT